MIVYSCTLYALVSIMYRSVRASVSHIHLVLHKLFSTLVPFAMFFRSRLLFVNVSVLASLCISLSLSLSLRHDEMNDCTNRNMMIELDLKHQQEKKKHVFFLPGRPEGLPYSYPLLCKGIINDNHTTG